MLIGTPWSAEEKDVLRLSRHHLSTSEIQKVFSELGFSRSAEAIQKQSKRIGMSFKDYGTPMFIGVKQLHKDAIMKVVSARESYLSNMESPVLEAPSAKAAITTQKKQVLGSMLAELQQLRKEVPRKGSLANTKMESSLKESLVLLFSDWHFGELNKDPETGLTLFDLDIAEDRVQQTPVLLATALGKEKLENIDECILVLAGDMVTGEGIFPHQEIGLQEHAVEQALRTTKAIWNLIQTLRGWFPLVRIVTIRGNHGRTAHSPEANWDNVIYQQLELLVDLDGGDDLAIKNRYAEFNTFEVKGWRGLVRHCAPVQAETAGSVAKYSGWAAIHDWDFFMFGHYHHWGVETWMDKPIFRNGCLVGGDDYAESLAKHNAPVQLAFGISEDSPCAWVIPLRYC